MDSPWVLIALLLIGMGTVMLATILVDLGASRLTYWLVIAIGTFACYSTIRAASDKK